MPRKPDFDHALIDADILAYVACRAEERRFRFPGTAEESVDPGELEVALESFQDRVEDLRKEVRAARVVLCFSDPKANWRKTILPTYKAHRDPRAKPHHLLALREPLEKAGYTMYVRPALEGDDVLGILATMKHGPLHGSKVVISIDKDLRSIPGWLMRSHVKDERLCDISEAQADWWHMVQTLTGDTTDNYHGCPGIGIARATRLLDGCRGAVEMWGAVVTAYEQKGLAEEDALVQARVARICRASDFDFKRKEVRLWSPPQAC